jgi:DHA1 family bicyclomycin/chloramphenicol resistance-like MFS transporter
LTGYPQIAGTASSLLGAARFAFGGIAAPIVGVAGSLSILPLGLVTTVAIALAAVTALNFLSRPTAAPAVGALPTPATEGTLTCVE